MDYKLTIELVPSIAWYSNVRSNVPSATWDLMRRKSYKSAGYKCEICGGNGQEQGYKHPVECHEIWHYDDEKKVQKLTGLITLCPWCHKCKHVGLAQLNDEGHIVIAQLVKVNEMTRAEAKKYIAQSFKVWSERSEYDWTLDISFLETYTQP